MSNALAKPSGLRAVRIAHRLTQRQLGRIAGVGNTIIANWEARRPARWGQLVRVADALNVSVDEILGRAPVTPAIDAVGNADRELLDAMQNDCEALFGAERLQQMGGWRRIARYKWLGFLQGAIDRLLPQITSGAQNTRDRPVERELPTLTPIPGYPKGWFLEYESPRQEARRLNKPDPKPRAIAAKRRRALKGASQ